MTTAVDDWASLGICMSIGGGGPGVELAFDGASACAPDVFLFFSLSLFYRASSWRNRHGLYDGLDDDIFLAFAHPLLTGVLK